MTVVTSMKLITEQRIFASKLETRLRIATSLNRHLLFKLI